MGSPRLPELWTLSRTRPELTAPSGRVFRVSRSREQALFVIRTLFDEIAKGDPGLPTTLAVAYPELHLAVEAFVMVARQQDEGTFGASLSQYCDVLLWDLTWADLGMEVRHA